MKTRFILAALALVATESGLRAQNINSVLSQWSIITSGDLQDVTDYGGAAYIGGNVTAGNSFTAGTGVSLKTDISLAVAGSINSGNAINVNGGSVVVGGSILGSRTLNMNSGGSKTSGDPAALPASPVNTVVLNSEYWSTLPSTGAVAQSGNTLSFNSPNNQQLAVFNITASQLFSQNLGLQLNLGNDTGTVLINVSGTGALNTAGGENFNGNWDSGHVIFNFYQASSIGLNTGFDAYLVAPNATITGNSTIFGGVAASVLDLNSEVDPTAWDGQLPSVPEPSTLAAGFGALAMLAASARKARKNVV